MNEAKAVDMNVLQGEQFGQLNQVQLNHNQLDQHDQKTELLVVLSWLLLAGGVLCFFLADSWMDTLLHVRRNGKAIGYVAEMHNEVRMRPRSTLAWLDVYRRADLDSGDTIYVGDQSHVTLELADGMELELGSNSLAQISFGQQDTINVKLSEGSFQVETPHPTHHKLRLSTGHEEKLIDGAHLRHLVISKTKTQSLRIVDEAAPVVPVPKAAAHVSVPTPAAEQKVAMIDKSALKKPALPSSSDDDLLNDFKDDDLDTAAPALTLAPASAPSAAATAGQTAANTAPNMAAATKPAGAASTNAAPVNSASPSNVAKNANREPANVPSIPKPKPPPALLAVGPVKVQSYKAIQFTDSPESDPQAVIKWDPRPKVKEWEVVQKNTQTGEVHKIKTDQQQLVLNSENPGDFEYTVRGLDEHDKPVTKESKTVQVNIRPPLQLPMAESPTNDALIVTAAKNRNDFVMLRWQDVSADQYEIEIADNPDFNHAKKIKSSKTIYVMKLNKPLPKVYWRVRALRDQDTSAWSAASFQMTSEQED